MIIGETFAEAYEKLVKKVIEHGEEVSPRGMLTKELVQETFCLEDPTSNLVYIPGRKFSICHAILESLFIFSSNNTVKVAGHFNDRIKDYSDDGITLYGDYGKRISNSIQTVIKKLKEDRDTRQALLTIHSVNDISAKTKDVPCTITLQFTIRNEKLNMHVYMRSNDVIWGTPYDVFVFTNMQMVVANTLNIEVGKYYHTATSMHIYNNYFEVAKEFKSNCNPVKHVNKANYKEWKKACDIYIRMIETNGAADFKNVMNAASDCPELKVLVLEELYRKGNNSNNSFVDECANNGDINFCKYFTRRWSDKLIKGW